MCRKCPGTDVPDSPSERAKIQAKIREVGAVMVSLIRWTNKPEDSYRESGVMYHGTRMRERNPSVFPSSVLLPSSIIANLMSHFNLVSRSDYDRIFKPFHDTMAAIVDLRSRHIRFSGTIEELAHRFHVDLEPQYVKLRDQAQEFCHLMEEVFADVMELRDQARIPDLNPWHRPTRPSTILDPEPSEKGQEWELMRKWVSALPETQRAIDAGRTLDEVICDHLYKYPEHFLDDGGSDQDSVIWVQRSPLLVDYEYIDEADSSDELEQSLD